MRDMDYRALHDELARLEPEFHRREGDALVAPQCPIGQHLTFRLDGVKASKFLLKGQLVNEGYKTSLARAVETTYFLYRFMIPEGAGNFFLCAFTFSDEVSFVLNNRGNHYQNRVFKIGSMLAGSLSAAMQAHFKAPKEVRPGKNHEFPYITSFDARPLILADLADVEAYLRCRWLISLRNALGKVLRLNQVLSDEEIFGTDLKKDLHGLANVVLSEQLEAQVRQIMAGFSLFVPTEGGRRWTESVMHDPFTSGGLSALRYAHQDLHV